MKRLCISLLLIAATWTGFVFANTLDPNSYRTVRYADRPIALSMVPGQEKIFAFGEDVQWAIPQHLVGRVTGEAMQGQVFLTASEPFERARFRFYGIDSNRYYLVDLTASERGDAEPIRIVAASSPADRPDATSPDPVPQASTVIDLTRYAMQQLYAPERLVTPLPDVSEVRLKDRRTLERLVPGADVRAEPVAQWRNGDGLYAVALVVTNRSNRHVALDPTQIRADSRWRTLALMTGVLSPANTRGDTSAAVVIAEGEWAEVSAWLR